MAWARVSSFFYGEPIKSECVVYKRRIGLVEALIADINARGSVFWDGVTVPQLHWLKSALAMANVPKDHPLSVKLDAVISKCVKSIPFHFLHPFEERQDCFSTMQLHDHLMRSKVEDAVENPKRFSQKGQSIEATQKILEERGENLEALELTRVNDELMLLIKQKCPNLKSLRINLRNDFKPLRFIFTDEGLNHIADLKSLERLELHIWNAVYISRDGLKKLLQDSNLTNNLKFLTLTSCLVNDELLNCIAFYKCLRELSLISTSITPVGLEPLMQSTTLQSTLEALTLRMGADWGTLVTNKMLLNLRFFSMLRELYLDGKWVFDDQNLQSLLVSQSKLDKLHLNGVTISSAVATKIKELASLRELYLGDCSALSEEDHTKFISVPHEKLETYGINLGTKFMRFHMERFSKFPNLLNLTLVDCCLLDTGFRYICEKAPNLTYLELADNDLLSGKQFGAIALLTKLTCLRVTNCRQFNDDAIPALQKCPIKQLELSRVSISDMGLSALAECNQLDTLMISACGAITQQGWKNFLRKPQLQDRVRKLQFNLVSIASAIGPLSYAFKKLEVLKIKNPVDLQYMDDFFALNDLEARSVLLELGTGVKYTEKDFGSWPRFITA